MGWATVDSLEADVVTVARCSRRSETQDRRRRPAPASRMDSGGCELESETMLFLDREPVATQPQGQASTSVVSQPAATQCRLDGGRS